ncbi:MAG: PKD domain-containing protein [Bradymonadaceae bacterium]
MKLPGTGPLLSLAFVLLLAGCSSCGEDPPHQADDVEIPDAGPDVIDPADTNDTTDTTDTPDVVDEEPPQWPHAWQLLHSGELPRGVQWAADDIVKYLVAMGREVTREATTEPAGCQPGQGVVILLGDGLGEAGLAADATDQTFRIDESRCGEEGDFGVLVRLSGGDLLGRQYAVYEWLHHLGVRFFHPEEEYVPSTPRYHHEPLVREHTPAFLYRSVSLHLTHPLELGDIFRQNDLQYLDEGRRYIDWQIKNLASFGTESIAADPDPETRDYGVLRGLPRGSGFALHNQQQGASGVIDQDDPRTEEEQIAAAIDQRMGNDPQRYPHIFNFTFNPSEFTEIDDQDVVRQLTYVADYFAENYPDTKVSAINHGTHSEPTAHYGVRYYDLPKFAPENLGVRVHTLMFYDLFRPAPVYGNENFNNLYDFMEEQYQTRQLWYYPEAAWWLTFDIPIPFYLPITIEARDRDIQGIKHMLDGKLEGHRVFGSGHEWGYWQNEYCPYRMTTYLDYSYTNCLEDIAWPMGRAAPEVVAVVEDAIGFQERDFIYDADLLAYLVGSDPETEIAATIGIVFHPMPPSPSMILRWDLSDIEDWEANIRPGLERMDADYVGLIERLDAVRDLVPEDGASWFNEIYDGLEATGLRARHGLQAFGAAVTLRKFQLTFDGTLERLAWDLLEDAEQTTEDVLTVVHRREEGYRYQPLARSIAGGPDGTEDDNWTVYGYRYLNRTHHAYYYTRTNRLVREAFEGARDAINVPNVLVGPDEPFTLNVTRTDLEDIEVDFGDGNQEQGTSFEHIYDEPGIYVVRLEATLEGEPFVFVTRVARVIHKYTTGFTGRIAEPSGTQLIESAMPSISTGYLDGQTVALGFSPGENGNVLPGYWTEVAAIPSDDSLLTAESDVIIPIINRAQAEIMTSLLVTGAVVHIRDHNDLPHLFIEGSLSTDAVVDAVVEIGGFEEEGARQLVAQVLGYTPETLPEFVPFIARYGIADL